MNRHTNNTTVDIQSENDYSNSTSFNIIELSANEVIMETKATSNYIYFMISGEAIIAINKNPPQIFKSQYMNLISQKTSYSIRALKKSKVIQFSFEFICDSQQRDLIQAHSQMCQNIDSKVIPSLINRQLKLFLKLIQEYHNAEVKCVDINVDLNKQLMVIINTFYSPKQIAELFYPIICKSIDFKEFILSNYKNVDYNVNDLIALSQMSSSKFFAKFKETFGITAKQWLLKQYANTIQSIASCEGMTVSSLMSTMDVKSPCHFFRICKQFFGCTPKQLIIRQIKDSITLNNGA